MSVSTEVQRTLVKSPPELWTELSNPEALARHLGGFGEIRIIKAEPETKVEWESEEASGTVELKQSGWGTKVTLSVTRTPAAPAQAPETEADEVIATEPEPSALDKTDPEPTVAAEPVSTVATEPEPEPSAVAEAEAEPEPSAVAEAEPTIAAEAEPDEPAPLVEPEPEPKLGFFARLFRKRRAKQATVASPEPEATVAVQPSPEPDKGLAAHPEPAVEREPEPAVEVVALAAPEMVYPDPPAQPEASEPAEDLAAELESLEDQMTAETTELLTGVLDRLGAAHHRPFSRG